MYITFNVLSIMAILLKSRIQYFHDLLSSAIHNSRNYFSIIIYMSYILHLIHQTCKHVIRFIR